MFISQFITLIIVFRYLNSGYLGGPQAFLYQSPQFIGQP